MALDAHRHFWRYTDAEFGWIADDCLRRDFLPGDCAGMDPCVAVEARQSVAETRQLLAFAARHDFIRGVVGWLPIAAPDFPQTLDAFLAPGATRAAGNALVGLRHVVQDEPDDDFILRPDFLRGVRHLLSRGLTYDVLVFERQLPNVLKFVDALPDDARLVLDHLGKPKEFMSWAKLVRELARRANVRCKISGLVTEVGKTDAESLRPYLETALDAFSADRLMFGSDWPVVTAHLPYAGWKAVVESFTAALSASEREKIMSDNAASFYGLPA
ncbi:MAG: amidohydrolase family protein [Kiritimatiellae bacterium]|nr:amidohydrolase family protein [Kiritimatiellia bacterium]